MQEEILNDFEDDYDNVVVALDNSAAFDTVDHKILLQKLRLYGFHESAIKWFTSYLSNRYQYVEIKGKKSSVRKIKTGIFQGSVLGPTLYIIYTNCITVHEDKITSLSQYADDGSIRQRLSRRHAVNQVNIQNKVTQIQKYMDANKLKLNIEKTQMMVVKKGANNLHSGLHLKLGDTIIKQESSLKILGLTIDSDLKFVDYLTQGKQSVLGFMRSRNAVLRILSKNADKATRKALAEGLVLSKMSYCCTVWMMGNKTSIDKLQVEMNNTLKLVCNLKRDERGHYEGFDRHYRELKWLKVHENIRYHTTIQLDCIIRHSTPSDLAEKFRGDYQAYHTYGTRSTGGMPGFYHLRTHHSSHPKRKKAFVVKSAHLRSKLEPFMLDTNKVPHVIFKKYVKAVYANLPLPEEVENFLWEQWEKLISL